jgi:hypothetical protein
MAKIELNWTRLLGFDQAKPGPNPLGFTTKIGPKDLLTPLQAKVGDKGGGPGTVVYRDLDISSGQVASLSVDDIS